MEKAFESRPALELVRRGEEPRSMTQVGLTITNTAPVPVERVQGTIRVQRFRNGEFLAPVEMPVSRSIEMLKHGKSTKASSQPVEPQDKLDSIESVIGVEL